MSYTQFAVIMSAAFQSKNMAKQILDRLSSGEIKAPYKTNVDWAFHTDQKAGGQPLRNNKEQKVFVSGEAQSEIVIGQHHAKKKQSFTNAKAFLNANKAKGNAKEGNNFDVYYDRNIDTNQKTALFKALYGGMYPEAKHLRLTSHDVELIKELKRTHGSKWEERFTKLIATAEANAKIAEAKKGTGRTKKANIKLAEKAKQAAIKVRDLKAQKKILLFILNNPEKVMRNPKIVIEKLNGWNEAENEYMPQEQQDQTMLAEGGQPSPEELIAMTNNMRGFGY